MLQAKREINTPCACSSRLAYKPLVSLSLSLSLSTTAKKEIVHGWENDLARVESALSPISVRSINTSHAMMRGYRI